MNKNLETWANNISSGANFEQGEEITNKSLIDILHDQPDWNWENDEDDVDVIKDFITKKYGVVWVD